MRHSGLGQAGTRKFTAVNCGHASGPVWQLALTALGMLLAVACAGPGPTGPAATSAPVPGTLASPSPATSSTPTSLSTASPRPVPQPSVSPVVTSRPSEAPTPVPTPVPTSVALPCADLDTLNSVPPALAARVQLDRWPWGAEAALSLTIDEGMLAPYTILRPEIEKYGWRATFFVYTAQPEWEGSWEEILKAHRQGHEISNHTHNHPDLTGLSDAELSAEIQQGMRELRSRLGAELPLLSFAYPYELVDYRVWGIVRQYHRYARAGVNNVLGRTGNEPYNSGTAPVWGALRALAPTQVVSMVDWNGWVDATVAGKGWLIEELHGVSDGAAGGGWEARSMADFRLHFGHIAAYGPKLWVSPMGQVGAFIEAREKARVELTAWGPKGISLMLHAPSDLAVAAEPLTLRLELPEGWNTPVQAWQGNQPVEWRQLEPGLIRVAVRPDPSQPLCLRPQPQSP